MAAAFSAHRGIVLFRGIVCLAASVLSALPARPQAIKPNGGSVRTAGKVRIDGVLASHEQSIFAGETVSTEADGAALARFPGIEIILAGNSELAFARDGRSALLTRGSFSARSFDLRKVMELGFGKARLALTSADSSLLAGIRGDGAIWIECRAGTISVSLPGKQTDAINLRAGDKLGINPDGSIEDPPPASGAILSDPPADPPAQSNSKRRRIPVWVYGAGVGGAVGAAVGSLMRSKTATASCSSMSPSNPNCQL